MDAEAVQFTISRTCACAAPDHGTEIWSGARHRLSTFDRTSLVEGKVPMNPFVIGDDVGYRENPAVPGLAQHIAASPS